MSYGASPQDSGNSFWTKRDIDALDRFRSAERRRVKESHHVESYESKQREDAFRHALEAVLYVRSSRPPRSERNRQVHREIDMAPAGMARLAKVAQEVGLRLQSLGHDLLSNQEAKLARIDNSAVMSGSMTLQEWIAQSTPFRNAAGLRICELLQLEPRWLLGEVFAKALVPVLPNFIPFRTRDNLERLELAFRNGSPSVEDQAGAAFLLLVDSVLWIADAHSRPEESHFAELAILTHNSTSAHLRFAHCIRAAAYGDERRPENLRLLVENPDFEMQRLLAKIFWVDKRMTIVKQRRKKR